MKKLILLIVFCLSLSAIYAQTIDVIHLKNGFNARGTITNGSEAKSLIDVLNYQYASGDSNYKTVKDALEHGRGKVLIDGPDSKKLYF